MEYSTRDGTAVTFILRLWRAPEVQCADSPTWRGMAVHVQSGTERGVRDLDDLVSFIETWMEPGSRAADQEE